MEFAEHFAEVHVIALTVGKYELPRNVSVYSLEKESASSRLRRVWLFYKYFSKIFFSTKVNFVFFHMGAIFNIMAAPFWLVRKFYGTKFYWWKAHGHINWEGRLALGFVDLVFTSTESGYPIKTSKRRIIGQAIDEQVFKFPTQSERNLKQIIFVGRIMPVKRIEVFVKTAKLLQDYGYTFVVVGPVSDETYFQSLQEKAEGLNIEFCGPKSQSELVPIYQSSHVFLNTSQTHSMDKTVLEGALCGCLPVTNNRAFKDLLAGLNLFSPEHSAEDYCKVIRSLESKNTEALRSKLAGMVSSQHRVDTLSSRIFG